VAPNPSLYFNVSTHLLTARLQHVKPVSSAILSSPYSLSPVPNPNNPLELQITVPPPTAESRKQVVTQVDKASEVTLHTIRQARGAQQKKMNAMATAKTALPDVLKKGRDKMEKVVEEANKDTKAMVDKAKKALES